MSAGYLFPVVSWVCRRWSCEAKQASPNEGGCKLPYSKDAPLESCYLVWEADAGYQIVKAGIGT
jgi:hypothetical protein